MCTIGDPVAVLIEGGSRDIPASIGATLARFGEKAVVFAYTRGIRLVPLSPTQSYRDASASLRRLGIDVDAWPLPPAGLFVVEERAIYLRTATPLTIAHEFAHGLDCALGDGVYHSGYDPAVRNAFARARAFVTPYAATGLDEYFAESVRSYVEVNDDQSPWPKVTRKQLAAIDAPMFTIVRDIFKALDRGAVPTQLPRRAR